jgi:hypothetical protein
MQEFNDKERPEDQDGAAQKFHSLGTLEVAWWTKEAELVLDWQCTCLRWHVTACLNFYGKDEGMEGCHNLVI